MRNFPKVFGRSRESLYTKYPEKINLINSAYDCLIEISELSKPEQENIYNGLIKSLFDKEEEEDLSEKNSSKKRKDSSDSSSDEERPFNIEEALANFARNFEDL